MGEYLLGREGDERRIEGEVCGEMHNYTANHYTYMVSRVSLFVCLSVVYYRKSWGVALIPSGTVDPTCVTMQGHIIMTPYVTVDCTITLQGQRRINQATISRTKISRVQAEAIVAGHLQNSA